MAMLPRYGIGDRVNAPFVREPGVIVSLTGHQHDGFHYVVRYTKADTGLSCDTTFSEVQIVNANPLTETPQYLKSEIAVLNSKMIAMDGANQALTKKLAKATAAKKRR